MAPGTLKWYSCPVRPSVPPLLLYWLHFRFHLFFERRLSRRPPFQSHPVLSLFYALIISLLKGVSEVWGLSPASAQCCGQCEILHSLRTHSHSGRKTGRGCRKTKQKSHVFGDKQSLQMLHFKLSNQFFFFFAVSKSYLQTRPQIWSSNFTVLALALEKHEDMQVRVACCKMEISEKKQSSTDSIIRLWIETW